MSTEEVEKKIEMNKVKTVLVCEIGRNFSLGQMLGNDRHGRCWAVIEDEPVNGAIAFSDDGPNGKVKYALRFESYQDAKDYCDKASVSESEEKPTMMSCPNGHDCTLGPKGCPHKDTHEKLLVADTSPSSCNSPCDNDGVVCEEA